MFPAHASSLPSRRAVRRHPVRHHSTPGDLRARCGHPPGSPAGRSLAARVRRRRGAVRPRRSQRSLIRARRHRRLPHRSRLGARHASDLDDADPGLARCPGRDDRSARPAHRGGAGARRGGSDRTHGTPPGGAARRRRGDRHGLRGRPRRALPRLRRARQRGGSARQRGGELRRRRPVPGRGATRRGALVPKPGFRARDDATYFPVPWLLSSRGVGVLVDNPEVSYFRLGVDDPGQWSVEVTGAPDGTPHRPVPDALRFRVFAGPQPVDVLRRFTARTGRQPKPAAPWVLGPWFQPGGDLATQVAQVEKLRTADAPVSVAQTYRHYLPCGDQRGDPGGEQARTAALHARGVAVTTYFNPMICESYAPRFDEAAAAGALTRDSTGAAFVYDYTGTTVFRVGQFDFT